MLADLPRACDVGTKRNAKGHTTSWIGYKLHVDTADGGIPISCIMTSASTHDSQVAIPLGTLTAGRVENLYDLMDAAYDSIEIWAHCILLGHKPIIDVNPRRSVEMKEALRREKKARRTLGLFFPEERRYVERSGSERVNGRLKDEFGGRHVRVRGYDKVLAHLMFGMTVLTASQLMRLIVADLVRLGGAAQNRTNCRALASLGVLAPLRIMQAARNNIFVGTDALYQKIHRPAQRTGRDGASSMLRKV